ncbi:PREDICTED: agmatine coumaroyltransferase-1-like [Tarenaya hassleriana]|uniref:agmatine coumaroyltransferase-1-like n=1 Tax=Tarenaya hassleriana TaxID=28532 RepID=UPI0008FD6723|nr:PREDICTED: agmatine coumaroyltransferase-1-like [Tarenaya hassleriana]
MAGEGGFEVKVTKEEIVKAAVRTGECMLPLSNLDLLLPPLDFCVFFCYDLGSNNGERRSFGSMVATLKEALEETLVHYHAFSGELTSDSLGQLQLLCNDHGVHFSQAYASVDLRHLNLHMLVPDKQGGVLSVQATELSCGSVIVSCRVDHRVADAYSTNMFLVSWAESARSAPPSVFPSFRRSLLSPRFPLKLDPSLEELYFPLSSVSPLNQPPKSDSDDKIVSRLFYVKAQKVEEIQRLASSEKSGRVTKLEAMSAVLWKLAAKTEQMSGRRKRTMLGVVVDGRTRLAGDDELGSYVGNVLAFPFRGRDTDELVKRPLEWVAREVHAVVKAGAEEEHFMGLIDWIEAHKPKPMTPGLYWVDDGPIVVVSSGRRFPVEEVDFGWGPPVLGSYYYRDWGSEMEYVMPMPSATVEGDWVIYTLLRKRVVDLIVEAAGDVFQPMSSKYLARCGSVC